MKKERLDKILGNQGLGTRREVKQMIREGRVLVNGVQVSSSEEKFSLEDKIEFDGELLIRSEYYYIMINKPTGCVTSTDDPRDKTVMEYLSLRQQNMDLFPIGRLDKDTEGLLIISNDGKLSHKLTSPKHHVWKTYRALVRGELTDQDVKSFQKGVTIDDGYKCLPAELEIHNSGSQSDCTVRIREGKFRQIRRMFQALGKEVVYLQRTKMGDLELDPNLSLGDSRDLTEEEISLLKNAQ